MTQFPRLLVVGATGWYGKTFVYEYALAYGLKAATDNLLLYASRSSLLKLDIKGVTLSLPVLNLTDASNRYFGDFDGLLWYAFILKNKLPVIGSLAYQIANQAIADKVFSCLQKNRHLRVTFFSSGAALEAPTLLEYNLDPYAYLKNQFERELSEYCPLVTIYPYATLGKYVSDYRIFAASSFLYQARIEGRIVIEASNPVVRSYGSVHDFSRLLLRLYEINDWLGNSIPAKIVPVTHTLDLFQLANEVSSSLSESIAIVSMIDPDSLPSVYVASDYSYGGQLSRFGVNPTSLRDQLLDMASGSAFKLEKNTRCSLKSSIL